MNRIKIATITCHDVYNYGASLQAYALQEYCKSLGCEYEIIDYKPDYLSQHFKLTNVCNDRYNHPLIKQLYLFAKLPGRLRALSKKHRFDDFTKRFLQKSNTRYNSFEELADSCPEADIYIAGSDQIWNTFFRNGHDAAFYLDFCPSGKRKISYAASFATDQIFGNAENFVAKKLKNFDAISIRESSGLKLLTELGCKDGILVVDPVFLLSANQWQERYSLTNSAGGHIAVYDCEKSAELREIALQLKQITGMPIHILSETYGSFADKDLSLGGPIDFLNCIYGAKYVLANSFHALAFSLIFKKNFFIVNRTEKINTRMRDFLEYLGLSDRLISINKHLVTTPIDFTNVDKRLDTLTNQSKSYLKAQFALIQ